MPTSFIRRVPPRPSFVFIRMRDIVDKLGVLSTVANFSKNEFIFSKDKNLPINRVLKAKKTGFVRPFGLELSLCC